MKRSGRWGELFGDVRTNGGTTRMYAGESSEATEEGSELAPSSSSAAAEEEGARGGSKPVVAVIGSGAVGCYYGGRLWESGRYDVKFHMRGEHYEKSKANGLNITVSTDLAIISGSLSFPIQSCRNVEVMPRHLHSELNEKHRSPSPRAPFNVIISPSTATYSSPRKLWRRTTPPRIWERPTGSSWRSRARH